MSMAEDVKHLVLGSDDADVVIESYINLGCPFCTSYINGVDELYREYIEAGKVKHVIKHVDKTRSGLLKGTVANTYMDVSEPEESYENMKTLLNTRDEWTETFNHTLEKVAGGLGLSEQEDAGSRSIEILNETVERGIKVVPSVFVNGVQVDFEKDYNEDSVKSRLQKIIEEA